jgi:phage shock protein E
MFHRRALVPAVVAAAAAAALLTGCSTQDAPTVSNPGAQTAPGAVGSSQEATAGSMIIDVRTPEEFESGHLEGAVNLDVTDAGFDARIAALDPAASYIVYCRSGNRSAQAATRMRTAGLVDITDLGSVEQAAIATGIEIVR